MDPSSPVDSTNNTNPQINNNQPPYPNAAPAPDPISPGMQAPPAPVVPQAQPIYPGSPPQNTRGKKKPLIIGIIVATIIAVAVGVFLIVLPALATLQAKSRSDKFMNAITTDDIKEALSFVQNGGDSEDEAFLKAAADKVKGSYKYKESKRQDDKFYALYSLGNGNYKSARTEMINVSGNWYLDGFVYDTQELRLIPGKSNENTGNSQESKDTSDKLTNANDNKSASSSLACLTQDDYKWISYDKQPFSVIFDDTYDPAKFTFNKIDDMFFKPDSTEEDSFTSVYDDWADFAKHNQNKQWKFRLEGTTYGSDHATPAAQKLANDRAAKVKNELTKRGVPSERIIIEPPRAYVDENQDDSKAQIYRRVQNIVDPTCDSSASSTPGR